MCASLKIVNPPAGSKRARLGWAGPGRAGPSKTDDERTRPKIQWTGPKVFCCTGEPVSLRLLMMWRTLRPSAGQAQQ